MTSAKHIRLLPAQVANKIAAGEVVERPASVAKEFIENSIDAGAKRIEVELLNGGTKLISISDDGCGMNRDDALMCLEMQATSKIYDVDDIENISTYGFRGEAIPSIASVSRMIIRTSAEGDTVGTQVEIDAGKVRAVNDIGFPRGTTIEVRDLFFNVPARRKFLRTYGTELAHVRTTFILQALSHPEISMTLKSDGRTLLSLSGGASLKERIYDLFGDDLLDSLREVSFSSDKIKISGFVSLPSITRAGSQEQYIFVNKRAASANIIPYALREAYPPLAKDQRPIVILFIDVPPAEVDVNVHPTKKEVRFRQSSVVRDAIITAVSAAIGRDDNVPVPAEKEYINPFSQRPHGTAPISEEQPHFVLKPQLPPPVQQILTGYTSSKQPEASLSAQNLSVEDDTDIYLPPSSPTSEKTADRETQPDTIPENNASSLWNWCRILGQLSSGYLIVETDGGFVIIDPRAAHERVLYDRMTASAKDNDKYSEQLLMPETVSLPPIDANRISENIEAIRQSGISIEPFGDNAFLIEALPIGIKTGDIRGLLIDISTGITETGGRGIGEWRLKAVAKAASRSAVSRMAPLPYKALAGLVEDLAQSPMPYTTPSGKPTLFFTSTRELERKFAP